jgi:hypothetical protein
MKKPTILLILLFTANLIVAQPIALPGPGKSYRIYPSNVTQTETFLAKSPVEPNTFFATCNTITFIPFFVSEGIYVTQDAGATWRGNDSCTGAPVGYHGGDPGIAIDKNGTYIVTHLDRSPFVGLYSNRSVDRGITWSDQKAVSTDDLERASLTTDIHSSSSWFGRSYAVWVPFASPFPLKFAYTDDGARNWSTPKQVNNPSNRSAGGDIAVGPGGELYTCWAGVTATSPFKEILVGFASSSNGGSTWNVTENAFPVNGITGVLANKSNIRVNGIPTLAVDTTNGPRRGWIYIVTGQKDLSPAGSDPDIILYRSSDGGQTWSSGIRVNQDPLNNGKTQYFPALFIDPFGIVNVLFYDDRTTTNDSAGVFLARSRDGGDTWFEYEISDHHFKPAPIGGLGQGYQGDNIALSSTDTKLIPVWMDNSSGIYQLWTNPVDFSAISGIGDQAGIPASVLLEQNHPNPFSSGTTIAFTLERQGMVTLTVADLLGNTLCTLINRSMTPGRHEVQFNPATVPSIDHSGGIFLYRLTFGNHTETRKMILLPR